MINFLMKESTHNFKGTKQLFENPILERLTRTHIAIPLTIFSIYAIALIYWSYDHQFLSIVETIGVFILGTLSFTLVEYLIHRFLFHLPPTSELREKIAYNIH